VNVPVYQSHPREPDASTEYVGMAIGLLAPLLLSAVLIPLRSTLPNADWALVFVLPVLIAAVIGGRWAGAVGALSSAICFDFFFTKPYQSLRISSRSDIVSFVVLLIVGLITGEIGIRARRGGQAARTSRSEVDRLYRIAEMAARGASVDDVRVAACRELVELLELDDCVFEAEPATGELPRLGARGAIEGAQLALSGRDFVIPSGGVELPVVGRGQAYGRLVLYAADNTSASIERRLVAVAIADELGLTLATASA
jgi:K+-sensing histidine kinase KdpD